MMQNFPPRFAMGKFELSLLAAAIFLLLCALTFGVIGIAHAGDQSQNSDTAMQETQIPPDTSQDAQGNKNTAVDQGNNTGIGTNIDKPPTNEGPAETSSSTQTNNGQIQINGDADTFLETYIVIEGANQNFAPNDPDELEFVVNAPVTKHLSVKIDGNELIKYTDYYVEVEDDGTEIEIEELYLLNNLASFGSHQIEFIFNDGSASTQFTNYNVYDFIQGEDLKINLKDEENAVFEVDCAYSKFENKVTINGEELASSCYNSREGSTIVELYYDYLKTLDEDEDHNIRIYFDDGIAETEFEIDNEDDDDDNDDDENLTDPAKSGGAATNTGDDFLSELFRFFIL